jgi:hypothetical protein
LNGEIKQSLHDYENRSSVRFIIFWRENMGDVVQLKQKRTKLPMDAHFDEARDPEGTGNNCAVLAAYMEDSMGGMDQDRFDRALETCECDTCS